MNGTNDTNAIVTGSGTASDPRTYDFQVNAQSYHGTPRMLYIVVIIVLGLVAVTGFLLGFYYGKSRKKPN
jgi:hypothetical protein